MVIITHEHNEALALAQRVAVVYEGRIVQIGTPEQVFTRPQNAFVADFTGAETIWHGSVVASHEGLCTVRTRAGLLVEAVADLAVGADAAVALRPEDVALARVDGRADDVAHPHDGAGAARPMTSVRNWWPGAVDAITPMGPFMRVVVKLDCDAGAEARFGGEGELISLITRASAEEMAIVPGDRVTASAKATALHMLAG